MSRTPTIGVLALQGDTREHVQALTSAGARTVVVKSVAELESCDGLVLPGGESTTMSHLAVREGFFAPLRRLQQQNFPFFGTCAGMILLANKVLDGRSDQEFIGGLDIVARRNGFGRQIASFEGDLSLPTLSIDTFTAVFIRAPKVEECGPQVEVLARLSGGTHSNTVVAVRQGHILATSFHPELTHDNRLHKHFIDIVTNRLLEPSAG